MAIRSGRFKAADAHANKLHIIGHQRGAIYRFFNSGDNPFAIYPNGDSGMNPQTIPLAPSFSLDVFTTNKGVYIGGAAGEAVEGIYDYLTDATSVRSGRFNRKTTATPTPDVQHPIIELSNGSKDAWYRILNSGEHKIVVEEGKAASGTVTLIVALEKEQSFDFEVSGKDVYVRSEAADKAIEGIYEFLGSES